MQLADLNNLLNRTPVMLHGHPALLAYLSSDIQVFASAAELLSALDTPAPTPMVPMVTFDVHPHYRSRLPLVHCATDPYTNALNEVLGTRYDTVARYTLKQCQLANEIVQASDDCEIVVLLLVDGLSYHDVRHWPEQMRYSATVRPCLAEGPTITRFCFPTIVGNPPVASRLFDKGFVVRLGFSYWNREDNDLTNRLFATMHEMHRCASMRDTITYLGNYLQRYSRERVYAQIVRVGLDADAHHNRELPPVEGVLEQLRAEINILARLLENTARPSRLFVTSDHGILWRNEFEPEIVGHAQGNARMAHWRNLTNQSEPGLQFAVAGEIYYALPFPMLRRPLRIDEAGVHGGLSFQESIVPFITVEVNSC
jgi:hypothetical protein